MAAQTAPRLLKIPQVADVLGCSERHVYRLIADGDLATVDIGTRGSRTPKTRVPESELVAFQTGRTSNAKRLRAAG
jgi:excisionase family DNA binding protein